MKKLISGITFFVFCICAAAYTASAASCRIRLNANVAEQYPGNQVSVGCSMTLEDAPNGLISYTVVLNYDASVLDFKNLQGQSPEMKVTNLDGKVTVQYQDADFAAGNAPTPAGASEMFRAEFSVRSNAKIGKTQVTSSASGMQTYTTEQSSSSDTGESESSETAVVSQNIYRAVPVANAGNGSLSINIKQQLSSNTALQSLSVSNHSLTPRFSTNVYTYSLTVENNVKQIKINAVPADSKAKVSVSGNTNLTTSRVNRVTINITAESGAVQSYTIHVTRKASESSSSTISTSDPVSEASTSSEIPVVPSGDEPVSDNLPTSQPATSIAPVGPGGNDGNSGSLNTLFMIVFGLLFAYILGFATSFILLKLGVFHLFKSNKKNKAPNLRGETAELETTGFPADYGPQNGNDQDQTRVLDHFPEKSADRGTGQNKVQKEEDILGYIEVPDSQTEQPGEKQTDADQKKPFDYNDDKDL